MKKILIPENAGDLKVVDDILGQFDKCQADPHRVNTSMEAVVVFPNMDKTAGWAKWCVVDNRDHQAFTEDFATLDGALIYATDLQTTCEHQYRWDLNGNFAVKLEQALKDTGKWKTDPLEGWEGHDHNDLVERFVTAIRHNVNGRHSVRYLTEDHDNGDGTVETDCLVELTFANAGGAMCEVDNALESMNGLDWRRVCDTFLERRLKELGAEPGNFDWPTPDARVTIDYCEDEADVVKTATVVWAVDERTWKWCNPASTELAKSEETRDGEHPVTEMCPHCDREVTMEWNAKEYGYKAFCPHCGKELMLCDECRHAADNPNHECTEKCRRRENGKS